MLSKLLGRSTVHERDCESNFVAVLQLKTAQGGSTLYARALMLFIIPGVDQKSNRLSWSSGNHAVSMLRATKGAWLTHCMFGPQFEWRCDKVPAKSPKLFSSS